MKEKTWHKIIIGDSRRMEEVKDDSVHLVITSPPYWQLKDYGAKNQIGFNDSYQDYIDNLNKVWHECYRVLHPGCRLCVNIGDVYGKVISKYAQVSKEEFKSDYNQLKKEIKSQQIKETA